MTKQSRLEMENPEVVQEASEIAGQIAKEEYDRRKEANATLSGARQELRNLGTKSIEAGNVAGVDIMPGGVAENSPLARTVTPGGEPNTVTGSATATPVTDDGVTTSNTAAGAEGTQYAGMTNDQLRAELDTRGVEYKSEDNKDQLVRRLQENDAA